ncbi:MAG: tetratricopeptide repeat protein [Oculatellaceae cyanobacterium Prado106]|nr:tetratricopeptide repeat protein [Oculatellaceae cyanobacterium Prado106]
MLEPLNAAFNRLNAAFNRQDYETVAQLLEPLQKQHPDHPWVKFYTGRYREVLGEVEAAEAIYRELLREVTNPKVVAQARQGLQRLEAYAQQQKEDAIAQSAAEPHHLGVGFLILEPIQGEARQAAAQNLARITKLDAYSARLQIPSRGWRLYRTGIMGEIAFYGNEFRKAGIPAFWMPLSAVQSLRVFRVSYLQAVSPQAIVVCQDESDRTGSMSFEWSEVKQRVEGLLPIFESVVDVDARRNLKRKEQTLDYAQVVDLHLPKRNCILRFCDRSYQFQQGVVFDASQDGQPLNRVSTRIRWNTLVHFLGEQLAEIPLHNDFTVFAETALDHLDFIYDLKPHIDLLRREPTNWDPAFHLYSGLTFRKNFR